MLDRPPQLTAASRFFLKLIDTTAHWSRLRAWTVSLLCLGCVSALEAIIPVAVSTALLYMLATACAVWCLGQRGGLLLGFAAVLIGSVIKHYTAPHSLVSTFGLPTVIWNTIARCAMVAVLSIVVNGLRSALALERWRASSDGLTGVLNKVAFEERLGQQIDQARAQGRALVLAYMDLDGFKGVNDRHGHSAGDGVLRVFATAATQAIRRTDLFARIGGDEFAALLSVRSCEEGDQVAGMLHQRLTAILRQTGFDVTCSMGALVADAASLSATGGAIELADALMYEVKRSGKNALRIARHSAIGRSLRSAYPPLDEGSLAELLTRIDAADRACALSRDRRHAA